LYQLAYLALVLENSPPGRELYEALNDIALLDIEFIQWGSADWFWKTQGQCNSYVIQAEPYRYKDLDRFSMDREEARKWLDAKALLFGQVRELLGLV
jgi:hypothetical protein